MVARPEEGTTIGEMRAVLPRTAALLDEALEQRQAIGAQVYVSLNGRTLVNAACGEARPGVPMTTKTLMPWYSNSKIATSAAALIMWERGAFDLDDPVVRCIPEFAANGKERITIRHLLTHTAGILAADRAFPALRIPERPKGSLAETWKAIMDFICAIEPEPDWEPGKRAAYHGWSTMQTLGELIHRTDGRPYYDFIREELFEPLGMADSWVGMTPERFTAYGDRIGVMHTTEGGTARPTAHLEAPPDGAISFAGGGGRGPISELGRLLEMLIGRGAYGETRVLSRQAVEAMTARQRAGMFDERFGGSIDWGLGVQIDANLFGRHCSPRTFGHAGGGSSHCFGDPEYGLVAAVVFNGRPGQVEHHERANAVSTAIYEDLCLVPAGAAGRDHDQGWRGQGRAERPAAAG